MEDYLNSKLTIRQRVEDLMDKMTIEEKIGQVNQHLYGWKCYDKNDDGVELTDYLKDHIKWGKGLGTLYGVLRADPWSKIDYNSGISLNESHEIINKIQRYVIDHSRLGIPALFSEECPHGHQGLDGVSYPTNIGKGNSFNKELIKKMAQAESEELRVKGINLALVSTLDLAKDPRWGRTEECFGEDPVLSSKFTENIVEGFQGNIINDDEAFLDKVVPDKRHVGVVLKHFIAQGEILGGHNSGSVNIGNREFHETYDSLIHSTRNAVGIMAAYNDIDGIPCHSNRKLLTKHLREGAGYKGLIMSDGTALDRLVDVYGSKEEAAYHALMAGVDLSLWDDTFMTIRESLEKHPDLIEFLNRAVFKVLSTKFLLGIFDHPYLDVENKEIKKAISQSKKVNLDLAHQSITLLKNKDNILPLRENTKISIIGPNGNSLYNMLGDYTAPQAKGVLKDTIFNNLVKEFPTAKFAKGCDIRDKNNKDKTISEAVKVAKESDVIILVLGGSSTRNFDMKFLSNGAVSSKGVNMDSGENVDLSSLSLGGAQNELAEKIFSLKKKVISILVEGRPHDIQYLENKSDAVLIGWYPGQKGGQAISDIIVGKYNPDGKLSISYPLNSNQLPVYYYQRAISKNDNYYDESGSPLFEFGFGIHYGQVNYESIKTEIGSQKIKVEISLKNDSNYDINESVLLFARLETIGVFPKAKQLIDFDKFNIPHNSYKTISFDISKQALCYLDSESHYILPHRIKFTVGNLEKYVDLN